jgi:hypothetical protein
MRSVCDKSETALIELQTWLAKRLAILKETKNNFAFITSKIKTIELIEKEKDSNKVKEL